MGEEVERYPVPGRGVGHEDYATPTLGPYEQGSRYERRTTVANDNGITSGPPPASQTGTTDLGKFYSRGMRGKIESIQVYCRRTAAGFFNIRLSPQPGMERVLIFRFTPSATWGWVSVPVLRMWNYDSLFARATQVGADISIAQDSLQPFDSHISITGGNTWAATDTRLYIRFVYTAETPGDVPVSGIVNTIAIPATSSDYSEDTENVPVNTSTRINLTTGIGYIDLIIAEVAIAAGSEQTEIEVRCDNAISFTAQFVELNAFGCTPATPGISLGNYAVNGYCCMILTKRFEFKRSLQIFAINAAGPVTVTTRVCPTLLR